MLMSPNFIKDKIEQRRKVRESRIAKLALIGVIAAPIVWWQVDLLHGAIVFAVAFFLFASICFYAGNRQYVRQGGA